MNLQLHRGWWWTIVCPPSSALPNCQKEYIPGAVQSLMPDEHILGGTPGLPVVHLILGSYHRFYPDTVPIDEILT